MKRKGAKQKSRRRGTEKYKRGCRQRKKGNNNKEREQ
jgi:hypothetical protein